MDKHIVIVGAGVSGIAAGVRLFDAGFTNVTILEAEQRVGGRIRTVPFGQGTIDLGAQWCHGEQDNVVYDLAKAHGVLVPGQFTTAVPQLRQSDGTTIGADQTQRLLQLNRLLDVSEADASAAVVRNANDDDDVDADAVPSLGEFVTARFNAIVDTGEYSDLKANGLADQYLQSLHRYLNGLQASDSWFDVALGEYAAYQECEGDQLLTWKENGSQTVLDLLLRKIPDPKQTVPLEERIQLGKHVCRIDWSTSTPEDAETTTVRINCTDGTSFHGDHVIWTGSLAVLQAQENQLFSPPLPAHKKRAIRAYKMGTAEKMFLHFERPFWPTGWRGFATLWRPQDVQVLCSAETEGGEQDAWLKAVSGVYTVDHQPNVLCAWISGEQARVMSALPERQVCGALVRLLRTFVRDLVVTEPVALVRSAWNRESNFGGSYSYPTVDATRERAQRDDLAAPLCCRRDAGKPLVQFAGEATVKRFYGTVHGAVESGWREADRLIALYKLPDTLNSLKSKNEYHNTSSHNDHHTINNANNNDSANQDEDDAKQRDHVYDVLVLGAGMAGLGAGYKLSSRISNDFLILEGQTQAGGRVDTRNLIATTAASNDGRLDNKVPVTPNTDPLSLHCVDTGAQWLHGKCNVLHTVAVAHDLLAAEQSEEGLGAFMQDDGVVLDAYLVKKTDFLVGQILGDCEKFARNDEAEEECGDAEEEEDEEAAYYPASVGSFLAEHFQPYLDGIADADERRQAQQLLDWHVRFQVIDNSCRSLDDVSARCWGKYSYNGESCQAHYNFRHGFSSAVRALCADIGAERFRYGCDVREVRCCVEAADRRTTPLMRVRCADGRVFWARHVVCTFSMGSLKYGIGRGLFRPPLPELYVKAIEDIGFETINKLFLQFAEPWWGDLDGIQLVFKDEHYEDTNWTRHISGFDVMRPGPPNTLLAWVGGDGAIAMERLSDARIVHECVQLLNQFTGRPVPAPVRHFVTRWHSNAFVRGAYSYISTRCDRNGTCSSQLAAPVTHRALMRPHIDDDDDDDAANYGGLADIPLVCFAGEAIHERYFSTAHGAFLSGIEQATRILDACCPKATT